jgi:hypothetical protein
MLRDTLERIADPTVSQEELRSEIDKLGEVAEPPSFWTGIANSPVYSARHRATCICQLLRRHVRQPVSLLRLAWLLDHPSWISPGVVTVVAHLKGEIPVEWNLGETVLAIRLFPVEAEDLPVLYVRLSTSLEAADFVQVVSSSRPDARFAGVTVLQAVCGGQA